MLKKVKLNLEEIEAMLYFWHAMGEREKISESYLYTIAEMKGLSSCYDADFNAESVRRVLSAITNHELLSQKTKKEGRFWNNNMWMTEDLQFTDMMVKPLKTLNLDAMAGKLQESAAASEYEELEVIFSPLPFDEYLIKKNQLIINFFMVKLDDLDEGKATINGQEVKEYIEEKLQQLLCQ